MKALATAAILLKLATVAPDHSPWSDALQAFKKQSEASASGLTVKLFLGGALGDELECVRAVKLGQLQAASASTGAWASLVPELNVLELPFLFDSYEEVDRVVDVVAAEALAKAFEQRGLVLGFWSENGFRSYGGKFAVNRVADLAGRRIRSQENPVHLALHRAFDASPVPLPAPDVVTSLQTGVVDGYDQAVLYASMARWSKASTHFSVTNHLYQGALIAFHKAFWEALPADTRVALRAAGLSVVASTRAAVRGQAADALKAFAAAGVSVNVVDAKARGEMAAIAARVRAEYAKSASPAERDFLALVERGLADYRGAR